MIFGMKDAANLILVDKATGLPALYINYANNTSTEWSADSVYALAKGANAIRWDNARNGTLTVDTETFDLGLLAMVMGSDIKEGKSDLFIRKDAVLDDSMQVQIGDGIGIKSDTISVVKLESASEPTHVGLPLFNNYAAQKNLPLQVKNLSVSVVDTSARITFDRVNSATEYIILRDNVEVARTETSSYTDTGLTAEKDYKYEVQAVNDFGKGPKSAVVSATTLASGVKNAVVVNATREAIETAMGNVGEVAQADSNETQYSYDAGVLTFTNANRGDAYAIYYMQETLETTTLTISAEKFAGAYEIFADARIRPRGGGADQFIHIHYYNARPQSNFTLTQSATEPTSLSIVFDLFPENGDLAEFVFVK